MGRAGSRGDSMWEKILLTVLRVSPVILLIVLLLSQCGKKGDKQKVQQTTTSDLISIEEISSLSVCEYAYNGIVQYDDDHILYKSTVKVSADPEKIQYTVDEENKKVVFVIPELTVEQPVIDIDSNRFMDKGPALEIHEAIKICRNDAYQRARTSDKLIASARENLKAVIEAWYSSVLNGYTIEFQDDAAKGGDGP